MQNPDRSKAHRLDCSFFNYVVKTFNSSSNCPYLFNEDSIVTLQEIDSQEERSKILEVYVPEANEIFKWQN